MSNPRETALKVLYETEFNGAYSNMALKEAFIREKDLSPVDKAFVTRLVYGTVSMRLNLRYIIEHNSKLKIKKISKYILIILEMGIYQIKYMDKVPDSAAVNESVKLAKRYGHGASAGFVNGVLRAVIKNNVALPNDKAGYFCVKYSYPDSLCRLFSKQYGDDFCESLIRAMNEESKMTLRVNTLKTSAEELLKEFDGLTVSDIYENALISTGFDIGASRIYNEGLVIAQDISAMMASVVLSPKKGDAVLDICAAPGGKTTHIAQLMENKGSIIACDIYEHKTELIEKNAKRMGIDIIKTELMDSSVYKSDFDSAFDKVLADVPCSGLGIIRRKPDIKWKSEDIDSLTQTAGRILENAMKYVKPGGELVFSTCTLNIRENEQQFFNALENSEFEAVDITELLPEKLRHDSTKKGYVTFFPNIDKTDGFFIAKMKRRKE